MVDDLALAPLVRDVADFPEPGIVFKDLTPLMADVAALRRVADGLSQAFAVHDLDRVVAIESRGFIIGALVADRLGAGFVPVRKAGKLPASVVGHDYDLEYGSGRLEIHADALDPGQRVVVIDDVLATGGTAAAAVQLVESLGAVVLGLGFLAELALLGGRSRLGERPVCSLLTYEA
ncbi:MAG: adenine phosphoribosyltransferase [Acidimicrobiales bacterium]